MTQYHLTDAQKTVVGDVIEAFDLSLVDEPPVVHIHVLVQLTGLYLSHMPAALREICMLHFTRHAMEVAASLDEVGDAMRE